MFYEKFVPSLRTYPNEASGWENGVYTERKEMLTDTCWIDCMGSASSDGICDILNVLGHECLVIPTRTWTETESTGFGIYTYSEGLVFKNASGLKDGKYSVTFVNPTDNEYLVSALANDILKLKDIEIPSGGEITAEFTLCSIEETSVIQFFVPTKHTDKKASSSLNVYIKDFTYKEAEKKQPRQNPVIFIASDSTVQNYDRSHYPQTGWGQMFNLFLKTDIQIENRSIGARSSRSFINEGRWDKILSDALPGDYCFVQWAHNDATAVRPNRYVAPSEFPVFLRKYINSCKARDINIILVTPVTRRNCDENNGKFTICFKEYRDAMLTVGKEENIPVIDLSLKSTDYLNLIGSEESKYIYLWCAPGAYPDSTFSDGVSDNSHLQEYGASVFARIVADEIKKLTDFPKLQKLQAALSTNIELKKPDIPLPASLPDTEVPTGFSIFELHIENRRADFLLIWNDVKDAVSYNVYRKGSADFQFFPLRSITQEEKNSAAVIPFSLPAADTYQIQVTAVFSNGQESKPSRAIELKA